MQFGISTHLYHDQKLTREHLAQIASYGFEAVELFATRSHFDYADAARVEAFAGWLNETGLRLHSIHAPIMKRYGAADGAAFSTAWNDAARRQDAVREADAAMRVLEQVPAGFVVVHLGTPSVKAPPGDNSRAAAARSLDELVRMADARNARIAVEVIPNDLSSTEALVKLIEKDFDGTSVGLCMDFGHAHLLGDVPDAIELAAEHLITTHVHDNRGRQDDHLVPYHGTIDWPSALVTMQKIGYDGTYMLELANTGDPASILEEARRARQRIERALTH